MSGWNHGGFFTAELKHFVLIGSECTDGSFNAVFFHTQHASFSGWCSGCTAVGSGMRTQNNIPA